MVKRVFIHPGFHKTGTMSEFGAGKIGAERRHPFQNGTI